MSHAARISAVLAKVPSDIRAAVRNRLRERPSELPALEREVARRAGLSPSASSTPKPKASTPRKPRSLAAELDAAVADGRIPAPRRAHYERLARRDGEAAVVSLLASLAPGIDPQTAAVLRAAERDAHANEGPWMTPHQRTVPGQMLGGARPAQTAAAPHGLGWIGAGPRPARRIEWSTGTADDVLSAPRRPDLTAPPFAPEPRVPNLAPLGTPHANGHAQQPTAKTPPGAIIDGGPRS